MGLFALKRDVEYHAIGRKLPLFKEEISRETTQKTKITHKIQILRDRGE
mgnify:CR=1 FL=1